MPTSMSVSMSISDSHCHHGQPATTASSQQKLNVLGVHVSAHTIKSVKFLISVEVFFTYVTHCKCHQWKDMDFI